MNNDVICEMITSANISEVDTPLLPPCLICGGKASGFHYGANTCEPCKAFFRRCGKRKKAYKCRLGTGNCEIRPGQRRACSFCRQQKCLSLGMSTAGIKMGRYTLQKRTDIILELKEPKQNFPISEQTTESKQATVISLPSSSEIGQTLSDSKPSFDVEQMIRTIVGNHSKIIQSFGTFEEYKKLENRCVEEYTLHLEVFGKPLPSLSDEQYEEIYRATGIDVDDRLSLMKIFGKRMEEECRKYINFVKTIPGFSDLAIEDKTNLVKSSVFDIWFLGNFSGCNEELQIAVKPNGQWYRLNVLDKVCDSTMFKDMFIFAQTMKKLNLLPEEIMILKAVSVTFSDRCHLQDGRKVEAIQWKLIQCLMYLLDKNHKENPRIFARVMDRLTAMRNLENVCYKFMRDMQRLAVIHNHPLLVEIFDI